MSRWTSVVGCFWIVLTWWTSIVEYFWIVLTPVFFVFCLKVPSSVWLVCGHAFPSIAWEGGTGEESGDGGVSTRGGAIFAESTKIPCGKRLYVRLPQLLPYFMLVFHSCCNVNSFRLVESHIYWQLTKCGVNIIRWLVVSRLYEVFSGSFSFSFFGFLIPYFG